MWTRRMAPAVPLLLLALVACSSSPPTPAAEPVPTTAAPATTVGPASTVAPATTTSTIPAFSGVAVRVTAADLPASWRPGCPVGPEDLRRLELSYWGFDDQPHTGALVVHAGEAEAIIGVFRRLYERRFPIRRMEPIDVYGGSDEASTAADNTSGFNCRNAVASGPPAWSAHAYGRAIDVNPVENPYILNGRVLPPAAAEYRDRSNVRPGMAVRGGELVAAFADAGWSWGGTWANPDYQHFSATGN
ncbi:MAG: M15 family metallopeptidase [Actinomycetota bacterium]|nr:M15 family metallopeptidase [Actinomycetota bacterium]